MFSQLRQGNDIYILEKSDTPTLIVGQVVNEGKQVPKFPNVQPYQFGGTEMVVDVLEVKAGEQTYKFEKLPASLSITDYGSAVVSDSRDAMLQEIETMESKSQHVLDSIPYHQRVKKAVEGMKETLNPRYKEEKRRDEAIRDLNNRLDGFEERMGKTLTSIEKLLSKAAK